jgi:hypothetical protein
VTPAASSPSAAASHAPRRSWTPEQDAKLTKAVKKHGKNWVAVAAMVPGRAREQCHQRWVCTLDPANGKKGKWTPEEDIKLTKAVKKHGKHWGSVAAMVLGRTNRQCRERWVDSLDPTIGKNVGKWKPEEDAELTEAVKKHGTECWVTVAAMVPGRAREQCRQRWTNTVDPANGKKNVGKWKPEEDAKLAKAVKKHGNYWVTVAASFSDRTNDQCRERWIRALDPVNGMKGKWTPEEDAKLAKAVKKHGNHWVTVAASFSGRTNDQCRERWIRALDPVNGMKGKWKPEEDAKLAKAVENHGDDWVVVAVMVPGRTNRQCSKRWTQTLDRANENKGNWIPEENAKLTKAVKKHGKNWVAVAAMVSGRTRDQCRQRWVSTLNPANVKNEKWTPEEDAKLTKAVNKHGKDWVANSTLVAGRTNKQCHQRWTQTLDPDRA